MAFVAKDIADLMGWGRSFVGTLWVAAVTLSALCVGAIDMAIADLRGSDLFNIVILAVDDIAFWRSPLLAFSVCGEVLCSGSTESAWDCLRCNILNTWLLYKYDQ